MPKRRIMKQCVFTENVKMPKRLYCVTHTNALEHKYIELLLSEDTDLIELDLPTVLQYLDTNYGRVPSEEVKN